MQLLTLESMCFITYVILRLMYTLCTIVLPPYIFKQPEDEQFLEEGYSVEFVIKVKGAELYYQWFKDGEKIFDDDGIFEGTDTPELYIDVVTPDEIGIYAVLVSNDADEELSDKVELLLSEQQIIHSELCEYETRFKFVCINCCILPNKILSAFLKFLKVIHTYEHVTIIYVVIC